MHDVLERLHLALADRYLLDREIGHGGMATVYLAEDLRHSRRVAVKVFRPELAAALGPERFLREIQTTARLTHPNILPLHDSGEADGLLYYVMPYVEGESLRDRLQREGALPLDDALKIAGDVADALTYAHEQHVVHRDIKPGNILLSGDHAMVADFGLAKALAGGATSPDLSSAGLAIGTPTYMSPEQGSGVTQIDGRTDVYALGCVLYEMLAGEPPFRGNTAQALLARHRSEPTPSVRVVRPDLPPWVDDTIHRALAKAPADRFRNAAQFRAALAAGPNQSPRPAAWGRAIGIGIACAVVALIAWRVIASRQPVPDANKVVVFPLVERGTTIAEGTGQEVALMIGSALEHTEPLKWIDGWTLLDTRHRADASQLGGADARAIARSKAARYFVDGAVVATADSTHVILRLNDAAGDSLVGQVTASGASGSPVPQLGLRAINQLLPRLLEPGRKVDLAALEQRNPAAIANWLQGEREYRRARYSNALAYQRRAVEADSAMAFAALKGALAAEWEHRYEEAAALVDLALRNDSVLPAKYKPFALGLRDYYAGNADSASWHFSAALHADTTWSEAWMALGEVRYHLFTDEESEAAAAFVEARKADPGFAPPLFHLAQIALRRGDTVAAAPLVKAFRQTDPDGSWVMQLDLMLTCLERGPDAIAWNDVARRIPDEVVQAGKVMASPRSSPACAESAFRSLVEADSTPPKTRWGAVLGLHGLLMARGRPEEARVVLDRAVASGEMAAKGLYVVEAAEGLGADAEATGVIKELSGDYNQMGQARLWYHGIWLAHIRDREALSKVSTALARLAAADGDQLTASAAKSISARLALLDGDSVQAIAFLAGVVPAGSGTLTEWGLQEPFGGERLLLARLLLARSRADEALQVAARLDHPRPEVYLVFLRPSLEVRLQAAEALGNANLAAEFRDQLARLK